MNEPSEKYKYCNHHHELTDQHEVINLGTGEFIANKPLIPLLKALNEIGLLTRTHHYSGNNGFVSILLDNASVEIRKVDERDSTRAKFNGKYELLINWAT